MFVLAIKLSTRLRRCAGIMLVGDSIARLL